MNTDDRVWELRETRVQVFFLSFDKFVVVFFYNTIFSKQFTYNKSLKYFNLLSDTFN